MVCIRITHGSRATLVFDTIEEQRNMCCRASLDILYKRGVFFVLQQTTLENIVGREKGKHV